MDSVYSSSGQVLRMFDSLDNRVKCLHYLLLLNIVSNFCHSTLIHKINLRVTIASFCVDVPCFFIQHPTPAVYNDGLFPLMD